MPQLNGHIGAGVDYIVHNKYIVAAPSYAKGDRKGVEYEGQYIWEAFGEPTAFPKWMLTSDLASLSITSFNREETRALIEYAIRNGRFVEGRHNETIFYGAMLLANDGMTEEMIYLLLEGLDKRDPTPQGTTAVRNAVRRAYEIGRRYYEEMSQYNIIYEDSVKTQLVKEEALPDQAAVKVAQAVTPPNQLPVSSYSDLRQQYMDYEARWLIEGWMPEAGILMLAAPPERFKTWLALDMAVSVVMGRPFLDHYQVEKAGNVLIIQQEDFPANVTKRLDLIVDAKYERYPADFEITELPDGGWQITTDKPMAYEILFHTEGQLSLDNMESLGKLYETVKTYKPVLVIIDPFYSLTNKDDYGAAAAGVIREVIKKIRTITNASFLFVHHTRKSDDKTGDPTGRQSGWGSQFINAAMEGMILLARQQGAPSNYVTAYRNFKEAPTGENVNMEFLIDKTQPEFGERYKVFTYEGVTEIEKTVKSFLAENGETKLADLYEEFEEMFTSKQRFQEWLAGVQGIEKIKRGVYALAPDARGVEA